MSKRNILLIACLLILVALFLVLSSRQPVQKTVKLFDFDSTKVFSFSIKDQQDSVYLEKNSSSEWFVKSSFNYPADPLMIEGFFKHIIMSERNKKILSEDQKKFVFYQVTPETATTLIVYNKNHEEISKVYFGLANMSSWSSARFENTTLVYEMEENVRQFIMPSVNIWQNKSITNFKSKDIKSIKINYRTFEYSLINHTDYWDYQDSEETFKVFNYNRPLFKIINMIDNFSISSISQDHDGQYALLFEKPILKLTFLLKNGQSELFELAQLDSNLCIMRNVNKKEFVYQIHIDFINRFTKSKENFKDYSEYTY